MLRIVEYGLLAVSLLVVLGLIVSGSRKGSESARTEPPPLGDDNSNGHESGRTA